MKFKTEPNHLITIIYLKKRIKADENGILTIPDENKYKPAIERMKQLFPIFEENNNIIEKQLIDININYENLSNEELKDILKSKNIIFKNRATKQELIALLGEKNE